MEKYDGQTKAMGPFRCDIDKEEEKEDGGKEIENWDKATKMLMSLLNGWADQKG